MDISSLIKKLDISAVKVFFLLIFNKTALYEYILDKANTGVNLLLDARPYDIGKVRSAIKVINGYLAKYYTLLPDAWLPYAIVCNDCFLEVYNATEDGKIVSEEAKAIIEKFQVAYSAFMAD